MAEKKITSAENETTGVLADQSTTAEKQTTTAESAGLGHIVIYIQNKCLSTQSLQVHIAGQTTERFGVGHDGVHTLSKAHELICCIHNWSSLPIVNVETKH